MMNRGQMGKQIATTRSSRGDMKPGGTMRRVQPPPSDNDMDDTMTKGRPGRGGGMFGGKGGPAMSADDMAKAKGMMPKMMSAMADRKTTGGGSSAGKMANAKEMMAKMMKDRPRKMASGGKVTRGDGMCKKGSTKGKMY